MPSKQKQGAAQANNIQNYMGTTTKHKKVHKAGKTAKPLRTPTAKTTGAKARSGKSGTPSDSPPASQATQSQVSHSEQGSKSHTEVANPAGASSPSATVLARDPIPDEATAPTLPEPPQVSPEGSRRAQSSEHNETATAQPKTTRFKEAALAVKIPIALSHSWHRVTAGVSMTNPLFTPFERQAFEDPQLDTRLNGGNSLMSDTTMRHDFAQGKLEYIHAEDVVNQCQPKDCPTNSIYYNADKVGNGKKDMQAMQRITIALARTPVVNLPSWRPQRSVLLNPSWWEMVWLACTKFYGTVAHLEESFTRRRTQELAQHSATTQVSPPPIRKRRKYKGSSNTHRKHTSFLLVHGPISPSYTQKEGNEVARAYLKAMLDHLWEADPDIILALNPHHQYALTLSDILPGTEEDKLPDKWKWQAYTRHFYLRMGGSEPEFQICARHDDPLDKLYFSVAKSDC